MNIATSGEKGDTHASEGSHKPSNVTKPRLELCRANSGVDDLVDQEISATLFRLTSGLPKRELNLMIQEATECENLLAEDISILEEALKGDIEKSRKEESGSNDDGNPATSSTTALSIILESPLTPLDRYWTASALLGRLRQEMSLPSLLPSSVKATLVPANSSAEEEKAYRELSAPESPLAKVYCKEIAPVATLLTVWKKISSHRAASVFKRPVRSEDAPGYTERIMFPMELSLIRKRIVANNIQTFADLHGALGLISHNCVKYNGALLHFAVLDMPLPRITNCRYSCSKPNRQRN
jgi:Bromodomain